MNDDLVQHILSEADFCGYEKLTLENAVINEGEIWSENNTFYIEDFLIEHGFMSPYVEQVNSPEPIVLGMLNDLEQLSPSKANFAKQQLIEAGFGKLVEYDFDDFKKAATLTNALNKENVRFTGVQTTTLHEQEASNDER